MDFFRKKPKFIIHLNPETGVPPIPVYEKKIMIGRGTHHVLSIPDPSISRNHVSVHIQGSEVLVTDLGTANGSKIDGQVLPPNVAVPCTQEQVLVLGQSTVSIKFEIFQK